MQDPVRRLKPSRFGRPASLSPLLALLIGFLCLPVAGQRLTDFEIPVPMVQARGESAAGLAKVQDPTRIPTPLVLPDASGYSSTVSTAGFIDLTNPFFQTLGINGRTCSSCHTPSDGWSVTPPSLAQRFLASGGSDPIFLAFDGANCPSADVSTLAARASSFSLLLQKGLIRMPFGTPGNAEFSIVSIDDPQSCPETTAATPAMFRRPLPATNLAFITNVMWDGRRSLPGQTLTQSLRDQASGASTLHQQATLPPSSAQLDAIVALETGFYTAQERDNAAGRLTARGATGGAQYLSLQPFFAGINDPDDVANFNPNVFTLYQPWGGLRGKDRTTAARLSIARGEALFNTLTFTVTDVAGLNDQPGKSSVTMTCSNCHNAPNVGTHSTSQLLNIGIADFPARPGLDISGLPVYTVQCNTVSPPTSVQTTDIGVALTSGKCEDVSKIKTPGLRGLAARAPYFHNGSAATLADVVNFYNQRFNLMLTAQQKADLVAFLGSL